MYRPLAAAVVAAMAASLVLALTLVPVASALAAAAARGRRGGRRWLVRRVKARLRAAARRVPAARRPRARGARWLVTLPALAARASSSAATSCRGSTRAPSCSRRSFPPEASLDEVDRLNHRVEDVLREFPEVEDVVRRTGRAERTEDPMPHTVSDVLVVLKPEREPLARGARGRDARGAREGARASRSCSRRRSGMRIDEGLGGTPADLSVRDLRAGPRRARAAGGRARSDVMSGVDGIADLRAEQLTGAAAAARRGRPRGGGARRAHARRGGARGARRRSSGEEFSQVWVGQRRFDLVVRAAGRPPRRRRPRSARCWSTATTASKIPLGQLAAIEETLGPAAIRREAGSRRIAVEASVVGPRPRRRRGGGAASARARPRAAHRLLLRRRRPRREPGARDARARSSPAPSRVLAVFVLLYLALGSASRSRS